MRRWRAGILASLGMTAAIVAAPLLWVQPWFPEKLKVFAPPEEAEPPRLAERVLGVEGWASEGFADLAEEFSTRPEAPTWEEVRRAMERRGCVDLRYALRIRTLMSDGNQDDQTYIHQPYFEPERAEEFLRYLRGGPDAAVWIGPGDPPWTTEGRGESEGAPGAADTAP